jgi:hypothetical protein
VRFIAATVMNLIEAGDCNAPSLCRVRKKFFHSLYFSPGYMQSKKWLYEIANGFGRLVMYDHSGFV